MSKTLMYKVEGPFAWHKNQYETKKIIEVIKNKKDIELTIAQAIDIWLWYSLLCGCNWLPLYGCESDCAKDVLLAFKIFCKAKKAKIV